MSAQNTRRGYTGIGIRMARTKEVDISIGIDALVENGFFHLEEHKWKQAKVYFEKAIEISPRNPYPYIGKLLITHKMPSMDSLPDCSLDFRNTNNFKTAWRYADEGLKTKLQGYIDQYTEKIEKKYQTACNKLSNAQSIEDYKNCYQIFLELGNHKDSSGLAQKAKEYIIPQEYEYCVEKIKHNLTEDEYLDIYKTLSDMDYKESKKYADMCKQNYNALKLNREETDRKEKIYVSAKLQMPYAKSDVAYVKLIEMFKSISGYKDSNELIQQCEEKRKEYIYLSAQSQMRYAKSGEDYVKIKEMLGQISGYRDSNELIQQCEDKIRKNFIPMLINKYWSSSVALIVLTAILMIPALFIFSGDSLVPFLVAEFVCIFIEFIIGICTGNVGRGIFFGFLAGLVLGLIFGIDLYPDTNCPACGGKGYFGGGKYGQMVDCPSCR